MVVDIFKMLDAQDPFTRQIIKAPFGYVGSKQKSLDKIMNHLPYTDMYVEPFGGTGVVLLNRTESKLEVFNDRFSGITDFYSCLRNPQRLEELCDKLRSCCYSREEFIRCRDTWQATSDPAERAFRWYYSVRYSFGSMGRNFGRATQSKTLFGGKITNRLEDFQALHNRLRNVTIENLSWEECVEDYDCHDAVFYMDPPYLDIASGAYRYTMSKTDHKQLLDTIFSMQSFVALSGYPNQLYDSYQWDARYTWETTNFGESQVFNDRNNKAGVERPGERTVATEVLWIKESK